MVESFTQPLMIACSGILYASSVSRLSASTRVGRYTCGVTGMKLTLLRLLAVICFVVVIMTTSRIAAQHTTARLTPDQARHRPWTGLRHRQGRCRGAEGAARC